MIVCCMMLVVGCWVCVAGCLTVCCLSVFVDCGRLWFVGCCCLKLLHRCLLLVVCLLFVV